MEKIHTFKDLNAWKKAHQLVLKTYLLTRKFPKDELFGARDLRYIASNEYPEIEDILLQVNKILSALIASSKRFS